jgi:hypothetical protein
MLDTYLQKQIFDSRSQNLNPVGYNCPFSTDACLQSVSFSKTQTVICDKCEKFIQGHRTDNVNRSDFGTRTKIVFLSDKLHSTIKWR